MTMIPFTNWLPDVQAHVPGCPRMVVTDAIRQAVIRFCQESLFWRHRMEPMTTVLGVREYELDFPTGTRIVSVRALTLAGRPVAEMNADDLDHRRPSWRTQKGQAGEYVFYTPNIIQFSREPAAGGQIAATLALKPSQTALRCDDLLFNEYRDAIAAGAISVLALMPGKPWTNPDVAAQKGAVFLTGIDDAKVRAIDGFGRRVRHRVKPNFF